jgi:hypothetical protein
MWVLVWFHIINNNISSYELGQYMSASECARAKDAAKVLVTNERTITYCFQIGAK